MNKSTRFITVFGIIAVLVGLFVWYKVAPGTYDKLADCLKRQGVIMYGAFWCPHCQATRHAFGKSAKRLPYVECSTPDRNGQTQVCIDNHIATYPTWDFPNPIDLPAAASDAATACSAADAPDNCRNAAAGSWSITTNGHRFLTPSEPKQSGGVWTLPAHSRASGELPLEFIASLASCPVK